MCYATHAERREEDTVTQIDRHQQEKEIQTCIAKYYEKTGGLVTQIYTNSIHAKHTTEQEHWLIEFITNSQQAELDQIRRISGNELGIAKSIWKKQKTMAAYLEFLEIYDRCMVKIDEFANRYNL